MRILIFSHKFFPDVGGIETHSEIMASAFYKAGHEVRLITWTKKKSNIVYPFQIIRCPSIYQIFKSCFWSNIVFENNICLRLSWPVIFFNRPLITVLHTWLTHIDGKMGLQNLVKYIWLRRAKVVISCSEPIRKRCWERSIVINNPYNDDLFKILESVHKTLDFVFLGRLVSDKGADLAIRMIYQLQNTNEQKTLSCKKPKLTIIGDGPERVGLENLVASLQLDELVVFKGALRGYDLVECLNQHRYIVVPSKWDEPFGMVALEGMACGCIPIVSDGGGLPNAVGDAGLVFKKSDLNALVIAIDKIVNDKTLSDKLRNAANTHLKNHRQEVIALQYLKIIESAVKVNNS